MLFDIIIMLIGLFLAILGQLIALINSGLHLPVVQVTQSVAYLLQPALYFQGVLPISDALDVIGYMLGFFSALFVFNSIMYLWSKIPWTGNTG